MPHPLADGEPQWTQGEIDGRTCWSRDFIGAEKVVDIGRTHGDGYVNGCIGVSFKTPLSQDVVKTRVREAIKKARWIIPVLASCVIPYPDNAWTKNWRYYPFSEPGVETPDAAIDAWADGNIEIRTGPSFSTHDFIREMDNRPLPYTFTHADGTPGESLVRFYLAVPDDRDGEYSIVMHGAHVIMDGPPTLRLINFVLQYVVDPVKHDEEYVVGSWGNEWRNLPVGPMTATGGARDDWDTEGVKLKEKIAGLYAGSEPPLTITPPREKVARVGDMQRPQQTIDEVSTREMLRQLKEAGFTFTHLVDAATALTIVKFAKETSGAIITDESNVIVSPPIGQDRYRLPQYNTISQIATGLIMGPAIKMYVVRDMQGQPTQREQLLHMMARIKAQYALFTANKNLPHLAAADKVEETDVVAAMEGIRAGLGAGPTNLGRIEGVVRTDPGVLRVTAFCVGHRCIGRQLYYHVWTVGSVLTLQVQTTDAWDEPFLQRLTNEIRETMLSFIAQ
ncbi:hypothetical protein CONPUDRAFT_128699 [Coniophora puteana RWD-64-598 SS2]|uniref:CoA-dependent acyltransferase n=1 Tax=Coniophora puteana (strain RWD-64-598) TaxID=741705 RepID=A0A5M3MG61_CONPW|nr:uncharacterized protein CONPUDRAFT_128699 [Coniophora puteana RWD-64-598 SS2]EIW77744.1 hypothetical protein CONPUDRAFT_128699 [Coniophora puteana RWD-64-598 SS2]